MDVGKVPGLVWPPVRYDTVHIVVLVTKEEGYFFGLFGLGWWGCGGDCLHSLVLNFQNSHD
jgi:hypothetical protein